MKKLLFALVFVSLMRTAHAVPTGCFVEDGTGTCYWGYFSSRDCDQWNMTSYNFGIYIYSMCSYVNSLESSQSSCAAAYSACASNLSNYQAAYAEVVSQRDRLIAERDSVIAARDRLQSQFNESEKIRQGWVSYAGKRDKLIRKLYRACGTKCRRIK